MAEDPIDTLSRSIMEIFSNTRSENFDYINQRTHYAKQSTIYSSNQKSFYCVCITDPVISSPALSGYGGGTTNLEGSDPNAIEKRVVKISFAGRDVAKNGALPAIHLLEGDQSTYLPFANEATIINQYFNPTIGSIMVVREEAGQYIVEQVIGNEEVPYEYEYTPSSAAGVYSRKTPRRTLKSYQLFPCIAETTAGNRPCYRGDGSPIKQYDDHSMHTTYILDYQDYVILGDHLKIVLDHIAQFESGGDLQSHNVGEAGKSVDLIKVLGKNLTDMTVAELQRNMKSSREGEEQMYGILFATGRYQIIPRTLFGIVENLKSRGLPDPEKLLYDIEAQKAFGAYLLLTKRKNLGKYIMGLNSNLHSAGNDLAFEWAAFPLSKPAMYGKPKRRYGRGSSPYAGKAGNKTKASRLSPMEGALNKMHLESKRILQSSEASLKDEEKAYKKLIEKYRDSKKA